MSTYIGERFRTSIYKGRPAILDTKTSSWHIGYMLHSEAQQEANTWNNGALRPDEVQAIAAHFFIAAVWASAPEGTRPRVTDAAFDTARSMVREFVAAIGLPMFRATLDAYESAGLHPDCGGDPCAAFGHDLYLTLERSGVGFWDREELREVVNNTGHPSDGFELREWLTSACHASRWSEPHGAGYLEFYRGWVYFRPPLNKP